ncbi:MAG: biotin-dependent carboxyltransferase family protein [Hyphomicrobiales bacterium]|nr:biotin-dependent carboxyltransferase family protein [Hyphomicrobiales bacterium]
MSAALRIVHAGPGVSLQDAGRWGYLRYGVTAAGPMDVLAHEAANCAAGAPPDAAAIEISVGGLELVAEDASIGCAIVGGGFRVALDGAALPSDCMATLAPGQRLSIRAGGSGSWAYLAPFARVERTPILGSLSMHARSGMGGAGLLAGEALALADLWEGPATPRALAPVRPAGSAPLRIVAGPQSDYFDADNFARFLEGPWRVSPRSDRMAYALEGPKIGHSKGFNIVSDGIAFGAIQIPGDGQPFVQMADRAPTGGYPKIGTVIAADLGRLAQMRPGDALHFSAVSVEEAVAAWKAARQAMAVAMAQDADLKPESLLALNLIGGVIFAEE